MKSNIYTLIIFALVFLAASLTKAQQNWRSLMHNPSANFFAIQDSFEQEFEGLPYQKGLGIKQFRRWEYYWQGRVDENGNFPAPGNVLSEMYRYYDSHTESRNYLNGSGNWSLLGPVDKPQNGTGQPNGNGRLNCIAFDPVDPNTLYVGAPSGGFWKSTNNGQSWSQYVTGLTRLGISSIVVHPNNTNIIYIGTGDRDGGDAPGYGVWQSTDGGLTWAAHNSGMGNRTVNEIVMDPNNPNILIAITNNRIYRTTNGGANWTQVFSGHNCKDIAMHPGNSNILYAAGTNFYRSIDNGQSWTQITAGVPTGVQRLALAVSANQPNYIYILAGDGSGLVALSRSTNSGASFNTRSNSPNILGYSNTGNDNNSQAWYDLVLAANPLNANEIYVAGVNIWKSTDGGQNWSIVAHWTGSGADDVHADHHALEFSPHNNTLYNGNDGGIYQTTNAGTNWNELSSGLYIAQIYKIGTSQQSQDKVINGYQDNGTSINIGSAFTTEIGGDGMECIIDPTNDNYMYGALYYGDIRRSTNGGSNFNSIVGPINENGGWVSPYTLDPNNANRMYAGFDNVWRNNDVRNTTNWTQISNFTGTSNMTDMQLAPSNSSVMYVSRARNGERFFRSTNATAANPTWTNLSGVLPVNATPKDIEIDPNDPSHLFIALNNDIYESTNSGNSWTNISGTLPNISINTIVLDKDSPVDAMYVGMDVGVYYRDNSLSDWLMYSTGLPNVEVTELEIYRNPNECKSTLYAATYGLGLWKGDLKDPGSIAAVACFDISQTSICSGDRVDLTDLSSFSPTSWSWTISPATFNYVGGTNASSQNPQVVFNAAGAYSVQLSATNAIGADVVTKANLITVSSSTNAISFNDDFESYANCGNANDCGVTTCPFGSTLWSNLTNGTEDDIDFRIDNGGTPSNNTGPSTDYNPGNAVGKYAFVEASGNCDNQTAILQSNCLYLDGVYNFELGYHMFGANVGSLHIDIFANGIWNNDIGPALTGDQGNNWNSMTVDLTAYTGNSVKLRIRAITGNGFASDIAIDDIRFEQTLLSTNLVSIDANCNQSSYNQIDWEMSDNDYSGVFYIEKLGSEWSTIGELESNGTNRYRFKDSHPLLGQNLYRLKWEDTEGASHYSAVVTTDCVFNTNSIEIFPNPFQESVSIQFYIEKAASLSYKLTTVLGEFLKRGDLEGMIGLNTYTLPFDDLAQGVYLVHINGKMFKLIKQ